MRKTTDIQLTWSDRVFDIVNLVLLSVLLIIFIYPLYFVVISSISDPNAVWNGEVILWPKGISSEGYKTILAYKEIWMGYLNSIIYTFSGIALNLFITITAAYSLSRGTFRMRGLIMKLFIFTMFFSGGLIPLYLLVKRLGMLNSIWALLLPSAASVTNIIITRTYFQTNIPEELREAAFLDGCNHFIFLSKIVIPLSKAIIAVMALYYGVGHWNGFFAAMIYLQDRTKFPLQLILREVLVLSSNIVDSGMDPEAIARQQKLGDLIKYGVIIISSLPAIAVYPFIQKYFVKGVMIGAVKG